MERSVIFPTRRKRSSSALRSPSRSSSSESAKGTLARWRNLTATIRSSKAKEATGQKGTSFRSPPRSSALLLSSRPNQFVPFRKYSGNRAGEQLSEAVLAEMPYQLLAYMCKNRVKPAVNWPFELPNEPWVQ
mmetsp:Transcript_11146/g.37853  ORF Transcript_11146/g.37853 Transcript_11146/m.37853 type:complete len:132 (+) Transcript_11146:1330-1725(+)